MLGKHFFVQAKAFLGLAMLQANKRNAQINDKPAQHSFHTDLEPTCRQTAKSHPSLYVVFLGCGSAQGLSVRENHCKILALQPINVTIII